MRKYYLLVCVIMLCSCCLSKNEKTTNTAKEHVCDFTTAEPFDEFWDEFNTDSITQTNRIIFPLINLLLKDDFCSFDTVLIPKEDWVFMDVEQFPSSYIINISQEKDNTCEVVFQIEDTGVEVIYHFAIKNGKWYLVAIIDKSM